MDKNKKKIPLPILILLISLVVGLCFVAIGGAKQIMAKKTNEKRYNEAYNQYLENVENAKAKLAEIDEELSVLEAQYEEKQQECDSIVAGSDNWFAKKSQCNRESMNLSTEISSLENDRFIVNNADYTVRYNNVKPMSYLIFYIIGGSVFLLGAIAAFIIYLVKGKKTY